jgi:hypothetical protein
MGISFNMLFPAGVKITDCFGNPKYLGNFSYLYSPLLKTDLE